MSGGYFDYKQYEIAMMADTIEQELKNNGKIIPKEQLEYWQEEGQKYSDWSNETQDIMKMGVDALRIAHILAQRIDWYLSGDDGEESLRDRLKEDLDKLDLYTDKFYKK